ncbi:MAG: RHS repeat-associated core domain-containing protein [Bacteroidota bacterium]|nr:RHS repeat-associated core domain-containing protein [Bacteroidota bacterium]
MYNQHQIILTFDRNPSTWSFDNVPENFLFDRGYTGHEHLDEFGLINMNGRVYDAYLARFLSPDPFVQAPDYSQNFNRYSYAFNNPLKYTDPDGEFAHLIIGGTMNWIANGADFSWEGLGYFGVGAAAGTLSAGIGAGIGAALAGNVAAGGGFAAGFVGTATISSTEFVAGAISGTAAGITNGLVSGTGNGMMSGMNFGTAFMKEGLDQAWRQGLSGGVLGGVIGGIDAVTNDRNFWTGSPKQDVVGNAKALTAQSDYSRNSTRAVTKNHYDVFIPENNEVFTMEVEVPGMKKITKVISRFSSDNPACVNPTLNGNTVTLDFPIGTQTEGYINLGGWRWQHNSKFSIWPSPLIYPKRSNYSALFFYLKYLK